MPFAQCLTKQLNWLSDEKSHLKVEYTKMDDDWLVTFAPGTYSDIINGFGFKIINLDEEVLFDEGFLSYQQITLPHYSFFHLHDQLVSPFSFKFPLFIYFWYKCKFYSILVEENIFYKQIETFWSD